MLSSILRRGDHSVIYSQVGPALLAKPFKSWGSNGMERRNEKNEKREERNKKEKVEEKCS